MAVHKKAGKLIKGQSKPNTNALRGRNAGTSSRDKNGKQVGSKAKRKSTPKINLPPPKKVKPKKIVAKGDKRPMAKKGKK